VSTGRALPQAVAARLDRMLAAKQVAWRSAGLAATVVRRGEAVWSGFVGTTDAAAPGALPTAGTQFRMGSVTKTFTAVLVMQCRDDGLLGLDDRLGTHLPGTRHGDLTVRRMLAHLSGLQREPVGDVWERPEGPRLEELLTGLEEAEAVLAPDRRHHYSNLAYALLGEVVARLRHQPWEEALRDRVLTPLAMGSTTPRRRPPYATGYLTDPYADRLLEEPEFPGNAFAPAAELWSTVDDLGRWAAFLAEPDPAVLSPETLEEMCHPQVVHDLDSWTLAWGLGLMLHRRGERILVGHDGAMPGFRAGVVARRADRVGAVVLANSSAAADPGGLALDLALLVLDDDPDLPDPWRPGPAVPPQLEDLLGQWWSEGTAYVFSVREGSLEARPVAAEPGRPPAVFAQEGSDRYRGVSGPEQGEILRVVRRDDGTVERMYWATYPVTRAPRTFGA